MKSSIEQGSFDLLLTIAFCSAEYKYFAASSRMMLLKTLSHFFVSPLSLPPPLFYLSFIHQSSATVIDHLFKLAATPYLLHLDQP